MAVINAADYSTIKSKVDNIFGAGSGQSGYGQVITSPTVLRGQRQTAVQWVALRNDMVKARQHQTGSAVGTTTATDGNNLISITSGTLISAILLTQFNTFADILTTNKFALSGASNSSSEPLSSSTRTSQWNGTISHQVTITGSSSGDGSAANLRYFFNAGGSINFTATISGYGEAGTNQKGWAWNQMLSGMATVRFNYNSTAGSAGIGSAVGFYNLTTTNQVIFSRSGPSGNYSTNLYRILAKRNVSSTQITFLIEFQDNAGANPNNDENVSGTLVSAVTNTRPSGSNVSVLAHSSANDITL